MDLPLACGLLTDSAPILYYIYIYISPVEEGGARKGVPSLRGQTHVAGMRVARSGLRGQDERDKWKQTGSFWTRLRLGKAVAGSGVRSQTLHKK